ncbi:cache domain-containing protein [Anaeromyxobacter sp. SG66]|uniref:cache domain-containing protein n=1 Tax=Anaeromyxobacter sp. SG66 TaxID=2925410 RepID=UPI001F58F34B|nr:cache domain-containing protein [Anaeromyxobacter sp. SG66]
MRSLPVEVKLAFALGVIAVAVALASARLANATIERNVEAAAAVSLHRAAEAFASEEQAELDKLAATADALLANPELRDAFAARDRPRLLAAAAPIFEAIRDRDGITHFYFHLAEDPPRVFLRVHLPELFGDPVDRATVHRAQETRELGAGKELGKTAFALRAVRPWIVAGELLGYVELGQDFERFLRDMKARTGDDYGLLVKKKFLDERAWASVLGPRQNTWNDRTDVVVVDSTSFTDGILDYDGDVEALPEDGVLLGHVERGGRALLRGIVPLRDAAGRKVGGLVVLHDFTPQHAALEAGAPRLKVSLLALALAGAAAMFALVHLLVFRRLGQLRRRLETGEVPAGSPRLRSMDELGRLEAHVHRMASSDRDARGAGEAPPPS